MVSRHPGPAGRSADPGLRPAPKSPVTPAEGGFAAMGSSGFGCVHVEVTAPPPNVYAGGIRQGG